MLEDLSTDDQRAEALRLAASDDPADQIVSRAYGIVAAAVSVSPLAEILTAPFNEHTIMVMLKPAADGATNIELAVVSAK